MAKSALELAVETGKWDAGLKKAKSALDSFTEANGGLQKALTSDSDKMKQFVQMMGQTESTAKTAKGQMNDYKGTIEALTMQYNRMTDAQRAAVGQDWLNAIDAAKQKYQAVADEVDKINQSLKKTQELNPAASEGGQSQSVLGMMQVFGGNMLTKATDYVASLGGEVISVMNASSDLARQAEGVYVAFQRLGRPGLLDELKAATHGTVSEFELMKAAVQFNDFKLPLQELGTMLAFAQQKAKDTGQSVDYMVQSIVTGLGRKSKLILDNLGISAAELTKKMEETGDMTKAVGEIVREQMAKTGDYIDTTADKASRANAELQNQMLELGRNMQEVFGYTGWSDMATGIKTELVGAINFTIETIARAKNAWNGLMQMMGIKDKPQKKPAGGGGGDQKMPDGTYVEQVDTDGNIRSGYWYKGKISWTSAGVEVVGTKREKNKPTKTTTTKPQGPTMADQSDLWLKMTSTADTLKNDDNRYFQSVFGMLKNSGAAGINGAMGSIMPDLSADIEKQATLVDELREKWAKVGGELSDSYVAQIIEAEEKLRSLKDEQEVSTRTTPQFDAKQDISKQWKVGKNGQLTQQGKDLAEDGKNVAAEWQSAASAISAVGAAMSQIEDPAAKVMGTIAQAIATIALTFASSLKGAVTPWDWIAAAAAGTATMISTISAIHSATGYANGGIVKGNSYSGDNIGAMVDNSQLVGLNAGEVVLTKAMQNNLAGQLQGGGLQNLHLEAVVTGEHLRFILNSNGRRTGRGEYVTTNFR